MIQTVKATFLIRTLLASLLLSFLPALLPAQEVLIGDPAGAPVLYRLAQPSASPRTTVVVSLPFFDDFSSGALLPSASLWNSDTALSQHVPLVSTCKGLHPPSKGVATFDGAGVDNRYYDDAFAYGIADSLGSASIDLSTLNAGSNVWMSFFVQPGGRGDKPEYNDSLVLSFDTTGTGNWATVWSVPGDSLPSTEFTLVMIPLDQDEYFHANFRFRFSAYGSLNGELDQWHLDYVYLNNNRSANDTSFNDVSVTGFDRGILGGYTAIPADHYTGNYMSGFFAESSNLRNSAFSTSLRIRMSDPAGGNVFSGDLGDTLSLNIGALSYSLDSAGPFSDQIFVNDGIIRFTSIIDPAGADSRSANDTLFTDYRIDSIYARDDGVADIGYGLTTNRAFCQEYSLDSADTLTAIWIHFVPSVYYVSPPGTTMEGKAFTLHVWDELHPDSFIVEQLTGSNVIYSTEYNGFVRYPLFSPKVLDSTFWIGLAQVDHMPIGIGFDKNIVSDQKVYYESGSGAFVNTTQQGTLMIRPEFGTAVIVSNEKPVNEGLHSFTVFPQPSAEDFIYLQQVSARPLAALHLEWTDLSGRAIAQQRISNPAFPLRLQKPAGATGLSLLRVRAEDLQGESVEQTLKIISR